MSTRNSIHRDENDNDEPTQKHFRGTWAHWRLHELVESGELNGNEAWLAMMIDSFSKGDAGCFASNAWFARKLNRNIRAVQYMLAKLADLGVLESWTSEQGRRYLRVRWDPKEGEGWGLEEGPDDPPGVGRNKLRPMQKPPEEACKNPTKGGDISVTPPCKKLHPPVQKIAPIYTEDTNVSSSKKRDTSKFAGARGNQRRAAPGPGATTVPDDGAPPRSAAAARSARRPAPGAVVAKQGGPARHSNHSADDSPTLGAPFAKKESPRASDRDTAVGAPPPAPPPAFFARDAEDAAWIEEGVLLAQGLLARLAFPDASEQRTASVVRTSVYAAIIFRRKVVKVASDPTDSRRRRFAEWFLPRFGSAASFARQHVEAQHAKFSQWPDWSGTVESCAFRTDSKRFLAWGRRLSLEYQGTAQDFDDLLDAVSSV
jgi:hypothetical protein